MEFLAVKVFIVFSFCAFFASFFTECPVLIKSLRTGTTQNKKKIRQPLLKLSSHRLNLSLIKTSVSSDLVTSVVHFYRSSSRFFIHALKIDNSLLISIL